MKKPYFKNTSVIGDLTIDYVIYELDMPIIFTLKDETDKRYFCVCIDASESQRWILSEVSPQMIVDVLKSKLTIREALRGVEGISFLLTWEYKEKILRANRVFYDCIDNDDLPVEGFYLEDDIEDHIDYIDELRNLNSIQFSNKYNIEYSVNQITKMINIPWVVSSNTVIFKSMINKSISSFIVQNKNVVIVKNHIEAKITKKSLVDKYWSTTGEVHEREICFQK